MGERNVRPLLITTFKVNSIISFFIFGDFKLNNFYRILTTITYFIPFPRSTISLLINQVRIKNYNVSTASPLWNTLSLIVFQGVIVSGKMKLFDQVF
jgi:hypothetical protein